MTFKFVFLPPVTQIERDWADSLRRDFPSLQTAMCQNEEDVAQEIVDADGAFGAISPGALGKAKRLSWLQCPVAAPLPEYYHAELIAHPVVVTNMRETFSDHIAQHIMAFVLSFSRGLHYYLPHQFRGEWAPRLMNTGTVHLAEATMLLMGLGGVGAETARVAAPFGLKVIATDARRADRPDGVSELHPPEALDALLPRADFVVSTVPHTPATHGMMYRDRFRSMKPSAFFINVGRGKTVRQDDLVDALAAGEIAGAALDVFDEDPLPAGHPLWTMPNVLLTPHTASYGPYLFERRFEILRSNCEAILNGQPLRNVVEKAARY